MLANAIVDAIVDAPLAIELSSETHIHQFAGDCSQFDSELMHSIRLETSAVERNFPFSTLRILRVLAIVRPDSSHCREREREFLLKRSSPKLTLKSL